MVNITYGFIFLLISAFADIHNDADRLSWIQRQGPEFSDERAARLVLGEYRSHRHAWKVVHETIVEGMKRKGPSIAQDQTIWASFEIASGNRTEGVGIVQWQPRGGVAKEYQVSSPLFDDRAAIVARPPLDPIPGVRRRCWLGNDMMVIDIQIPDTSPSGLDQGMDRLLSVTADMQRMLTVHPRDGVTLPADSPKKVGETCHFFMFRFLAGNEVVNEQQFFERYCSDAAHDPKVLRFIEHVNQDVLEIEHGKERSPYVKFQNEEMPWGSYAIAELALRDRSHVAVLAARIEEWNMEYETWHMLVIDRVLKKYGPCDETLELLAARSARGAGQHGDENLLAAFQDPDYRAWLGEGDRLEQMMRRSLVPAHRDLARGYDPAQAFYTEGLTDIAECWCQGDLGEYRRMIARAEKVLGENLRYIPDWADRVKRNAPTRAPDSFTWSTYAGPWDVGYRRWLNLKIPDEQLNEMR